MYINHGIIMRGTNKFIAQNFFRLPYSDLN